MNKKISEKEFIEKFADKWNEKLRKYLGNYIGRLNLIYMLRIFLKAYKGRNHG